MLVAEARAVAAAWVRDHEAGAPGFRGAFLTGSAIAHDPGSELPATSDIDILVAVDGGRDGPKRGKFPYGGVLLDVAHLPWDELVDAQRVADCYYLAPSFVGDHLLADPTGHLTRLREQIAPSFATREPVTRRCEDVLGRIEARTATVDPAAAWHEQVTACLFATSLLTQVPLVAALRPPTVRLRYLAAREVLVAAGQAEVYGRLLALTGCAGLDRAVVQRHLDGLADTFDTAAASARTPFDYSGDISPAARPVAIDGSRALVDAGFHREAVFWIVATLSRCQTVLAADAPGQVAAAAAERFRAAAADLLGLATPVDLRARNRAVRAYLPELRATARAMSGGRPAHGAGLNRPGAAPRTPA